MEKANRLNKKIDKKLRKSEKYKKHQIKEYIKEKQEYRLNKEALYEKNRKILSRQRKEYQMSNFNNRF
jgi:hypothetical protein